MSKKLTLNKGSFIEALSSELDIGKKAAGDYLETAIGIITKTITKGGEVNITGFGKFYSSKRAARKGRNPATGEAIKVPASTVPRFSAGKSLKLAVNKKK
jgi:DNA-binding protein HU-beta